MLYFCMNSRIDVSDVGGSSFVNPMWCQFVLPSLALLMLSDICLTYVSQRDIFSVLLIKQWCFMLLADKR
uniref:Uncharacterized protein n=1 Tax=Anguilla anguilla TaxID=7936 RepID=A0A0E9SL67_ANGAN